MRSRSSLSVEELREITQKMNLSTSMQAKTAPKKTPFGRSYSAPVDLQAHAQRRAAPAQFRLMLVTDLPAQPAPLDHTRTAL
ncbi:Oidioi.mRNA.OKI2018_I69.chr1.g2937.t1.cds [Oikopleura dioica]|uniref:Oidioi.mRNA.OKI2018_I69.chr1.g2937.t1.cds n=1 Tax=Oikopleura dioica TaxID=34765 RepID=A0ABN7T1S8_OIKDI|nr:Oidioi.mRNA.OKI2018_I69.chr1.g2937.t1.cds [Oikopleura dioica]